MFTTITLLILFVPMSLLIILSFVDILKDSTNKNQVYSLESETSIERRHI